MPNISIIIRSRNEEKWIVSCIEAIMNQQEQDFEIILVDNSSNDRTLEKARAYPVKIIETDVSPFRPGLAINMGIRSSVGEYIAIISAHCIPVDDKWLGTLKRTLDDYPDAAGIYGRQEPLPFTNELDKRDLINFFGLDRRVQLKDPFFHNANSMIRRTAWQELPFDEETLHIEDRIWAQQILQRGKTIVYEPDASVYHYHGINQGRNLGRAQRIVRILEKIHGVNGNYSIEGLDISAIIPSRGEPAMIGGRPLIERTIRILKQSKYVDKVFVATDNSHTAALVKEFGCHSIIRPENLSGDLIGLAKVYQYALAHMEGQGMTPDLIVLCEEIYPFRPKGLIDRMIEGMLQAGYDTIIPAHEEYGSIWRKNEDGELQRLDEGLKPTIIKNPLYKGLIGLACVTHPEVVGAGSKVGDKVGLVNIEDEFAQYAVRSVIDEASFEYYENLWENSIHSQG